MVACTLYRRGSFHGVTRGNDVPIVNAFQERTVDGIADHFPAKNATKLHDFAHTISK